MIMKMNRKYVATVDNMRDFINVEYFSECRSGSAGNKADCLKECEKRYGKHARSYKVISDGCLID